MTIGASEKPSLLAALLNQGASPQQATAATPGTNGIFAGRLDAALVQGNAATAASPENARALAEAMNLQMLHNTLSLAGDKADEPVQTTPFAASSLAIQALARTYGALQPETVPVAAPEGEVQQLQATSATGSRTADKGSKTDWLEPIVAKASRRYGVDAGLIKAVIKAESNFNPEAVSHAGAKGLMQLMPGTARSLGVNDSFDPEQNVMAGTRFLRDLLNRYQGDLDSALAAYNWGPGNVDRRPDRMPRETRDYLARVKQLYASYSA